MVSARVEAHLAYLLERFDSVVSVRSLAARSDDAYQFAVTMRPYEGSELAAIHYAVLAAIGRETAGRIMYVDAAAAGSLAPGLLDRGAPLSVSPGEREEARLYVEPRLAAFEREQAAQSPPVQARARLEEDLAVAPLPPRAAVILTATDGRFVVIDPEPEQPWSSSDDLDLDVAYVLERFPFVTVALAATPSETDGARYYVMMRPYSMRDVAEVHYALLAVTDHLTTGRVVYASADMPPPLALRATKIRLPFAHRARVRERVDARAAESKRVARLEQEAIDRARMARELEAANRAHTRVSASLQSGEFEVLPDPFPSKKLPRSRVLVVDEDLGTVAALRTLGELDVDHLTDGWEAVEAIVEGAYDLVVCSTKLGEWGGSTILKLVTRSNPRAASRVVMLASPWAAESAPPSSAMARVLTRPIDPDAVRAILQRWQEG